MPLSSNGYKKSSQNESDMIKFPANIAKFHLGRVVYARDLENNIVNIGHVIGFDSTMLGDIGIKVEWAARMPLTGFLTTTQNPSQLEIAE